MQAISPAIMRVIREVPQELKARELARMIGVRESDAASYLGATVVPKRVETKPNVPAITVTGKPLSTAYREFLDRKAQQNQAKYLEAFQMWRANKTSGEIAEHFGISQDAARRWVQRGRKA